MTYGHHMDTSADGAGARIRAARQARGMTQHELAETVGVSRSAVAQWETDRAGQVRANLSRIAAALGVSVEYVVTGGAPEGAAKAEDATELALLRLYRACAEEDRALLLRMARRLVRQAELAEAPHTGVARLTATDDSDNA